MDVTHRVEKVFISLHLGHSDLKVIDDILRGIIAYLRNNTLTPQIVKNIETLEIVRGRLLFVRGEGSNTTLLSKEDIHAIREAMLMFVSITRRIVPQSSERDTTLRLVNQLRRYLEKHIFP